MTVTVALLRDWGERLSVLPPCPTADVVEALGLGGTLVPTYGIVTLDPPPPGLTRFSIDERGGDVFSVQLALDAGPITRADLDAELGPGREAPRVHPGDLYQVGWYLEVIGSPFSCALFASFTGPPEPGNVVVEVLLRRDRAQRAYPGHYAVADRPVRLERLPTGEVAALALDLRSGALVRDDGWLVDLARRTDDVEEIPAAVFDRLVAALRRAASHARQVTPMTWRSTGDPERPWRAALHGVTYVIENGDFPVEPRYTLVVDGQDVDHLDAWPRAWMRSEP